MKRIIQDDKLVIEIEEPMRQRTLISTRKVAIPPRSYAVFDLECEELEVKYEIKPNPLLTQGEPNIWITNFVLYNTSVDKKNEEEQMKMDTPHREVTKGGINKDSEDKISSEEDMEESREPKKVRVPYCIYNFSYEHHSYIPKGKVVAFAEKEEGKNEVFDVEEVTSVEGYRNRVPKKKGFLPVPPKSYLICSSAEVSAQRKVKLQSKPVTEDTIQQFEELCECFPEVFSKNSEDIGRTNLITMDIDTCDHPPTICQKPYTLALKYYEWVQKEVDQLEWMGIITRSVSPWASPIVTVLKKSAPDKPPMSCMCINFQRLNALQPAVVKVDSKAKGNLTLHPLPKIDELYVKLGGAKIFSALDLTSGYYHIELGSTSRVKTAFVTPFGKWEFNMVPFGLAQAPAYFQALISEVLKGLSHFTIAYLDDIIILSQKEAGLKLKRSKYSFMKLHIEYLGHLISEKGIEPMPDKLTAIKEMPAPRSPKEIKQFLGLVGHYRKFIPRFSDIAKPLM